MDRLVFIDSDIFIDVFSKREPFFDSSSSLMTLAEEKTFQGFTSPLIIANVFYVLEKFSNKATATGAIKKIRKFINVVEMNQNIVDLAIDSGFPDFEDALEIFAAENAVMNIIVTRNTNDYKKSNIAVLSPAEVLALYRL